MNELKTAIDFVRAHGTAVEQARLSRLLHELFDSADAVNQIAQSQAADGGYVPFWADSSALDATCFRLAQLEQLGAAAEEPAVVRALQFIAERQKSDGSWEEGDHLADSAPPWCMPGDSAAQLYLTSNCAYWLAFFKAAPGSVDRAASFLSGQVGADGNIPSFLHTHWLTAGAFSAMGREAKAEQILAYLSTRLGDMDASNLAWMINALSGAGVSSQHPLLVQARVLLQASQQPDGRWLGEDAPDQDVHTTLEAIRAIVQSAP